MMLLDCVQQFGLNQLDFHPDEINYDKLEMLNDIYNLPSEMERERFDVKLTDAMITFMNYLHYGKFNVKYSSIKTDWDNDEDFNAVDNLIVFLKSKDFFTAMTNVQPSSKEYDDLQKYMRLVRGQYMGDNYEFPEAKVQTIAINMERLRWLSTENDNHILVNIPSKNLKLYTRDSIYNFDTIIGSISYPTPVLESNIKYLTVAPISKVSTQIFKTEVLPKALKSLNYLSLNHYHIYNASGNLIQPTYRKLIYIQKNSSQYFSVKDTDPQYLKKLVIYFDNTSVVDFHDVPVITSNTSVTAPGIGVRNIKGLLMMLLQQDGSGQRIPMLRKAFEKYNLTNFTLHKSIPVAVTYLTCEVVKGQLVIYKDVYKQDQSLINKMYYAPVTMIAEVKK
jgi:murein L,D-transpeptidase YcbB/YkuD